MVEQLSRQRLVNFPVAFDGRDIEAAVPIREIMDSFDLVRQGLEREVAADPAGSKPRGI